MPNPGEHRRATASDEFSANAIEAGYTHLASVLNGGVLDAERRTARDHYARRREIALVEGSDIGEVQSARSASEESDQVLPIDEAGSSWVADRVGDQL